MTAALLRTATFIDQITARCGRWVAWGTLLMVLTTAAVVVLRHVFSLGWIWLQEVSVYLHALVFLLGAAYTLQADEHVRVDVFYRNASPSKQRLVNTLGTLLFLLPTVVYIFWSSWSYVFRSWVDKESSHETGGLIYPFPSLLKTSILLACLLLALQGLSLLIRAWCAPDSPESQATAYHNPEL